MKLCWLWPMAVLSSRCFSIPPRIIFSMIFLGTEVRLMQLCELTQSWITGMMDRTGRGGMCSWSRTCPSVMDRELCVGSASAWLAPPAQWRHVLQQALDSLWKIGEAWQVWEPSAVTASGRRGGQISSENSPCWFENEGTWAGWLSAGLHKYYLHYMQGRTHLLMLSSGHWHIPRWGSEGV